MQKRTHDFSYMLSMQRSHSLPVLSFDRRTQMLLYCVAMYRNRYPSRFTFGLERSRGQGSSIYSLSAHNYRMEWLLFRLLFMPWLVVIHALTSRDSCSAFVGKGKAMAFQLAMKSTEFRGSLSDLGSAFKLPAGVQQKCEKFVCAMYGSPSTADVNELRYKRFCLRSSSSSQLPPKRNALQKRIQRVKFLTAVWRRCLEARPDVVSPHQHGWIVKDNDISID